MSDRIDPPTRSADHLDDIAADDCGTCGMKGSLPMPRNRSRAMLIVAIPATVLCGGTLLLGLSAFALSGRSLLPNLLLLTAGALALVTMALAILVFFVDHPDEAAVDPPAPDSWDRDWDV